jgi:hypothetical protein
MTALSVRALEIATSFVGVRETSPNRGKVIDQWIRALGLNPENRHPYCVAFLVACFRQAAKENGVRSPVPATAKAIRLWQRAGWARRKQPVLGAIFVRVNDLKDTNSKGHAGFVAGISDDQLITIEANTGRDTRLGDPSDREGDGVHRRARPLVYPNLGYLDFDTERTELVA